MDCWLVLVMEASVMKLWVIDLLAESTHSYLQSVRVLLRASVCVSAAAP